MKREMAKIEDDFKELTLKRYNGIDFITTLPVEPKSPEEILKLAEQYLQLGEYFLCLGLSESKMLLKLFFFFFFFFW